MGAIDYTPRVRNRRPLDPATTMVIRTAVARLGRAATCKRLTCSNRILLDVLEPNGIFLPETAEKLERLAKELGT